jgi:hypothetical protein
MGHKKLLKGTSASSRKKLLKGTFAPQHTKLMNGTSAKELLRPPSMGLA